MFLKATLLSRSLHRYISTQHWRPLMNKLLDQEVTDRHDLRQFEDLVRKDPRNLALLARYSGLLLHHRLFPDVYSMALNIEKVEPKSMLSLYFKVLAGVGSNPEGKAKKTARKILKEVSSFKAIERVPVGDEIEEEKLYRALLLRRLGNFNEALKLLDNFLDSQKDDEQDVDLEALLEKIKILLELKRYSEVDALTNKLFIKEPENFAVKFYKYLALTKYERHPNSIIILTELLNKTKSPKRKALIYMEISRIRRPEEIKKRLEDLNNAWKCYPSFEIIRERILIFYTAGYLEVAEELLDGYETSCVIGQDYPLLLVKASISRYLKKDLMAARSLYMRIVTLAPESYKEYFEKQIEMLEPKKEKPDSLAK
eukprot:TRINITY_DN3316_c0_g1_i1.p1 TRINITY_DN3316_c0_g1~~TRINITY_DN3316_c0_g1_i1.p1  ORF type:complete len:370 (-),score=94.45 TRINITY_DN3316_c0_g1_i1:122-1231(-)